MIKTFAQLKRDLQNIYLNNGSIKTLTNNIKPEKNGQTRQIHNLQTNAIIFKDETTRTGNSYLWYPKTSYIKYYDDILEIYEDTAQTKLLFKYQLQD